MDSVVNPTNLWVALLYLAIAVAGLSLTAGALIAWRRRPIKKDQLQQYKLHERLSQLASAVPADPKGTAIDGRVHV